MDRRLTSREWVLSGFAEDARQAITLAHEDAHARGHARLGTGHILRGLLRQETGTGARMLKSLGMTLARADGGVVKDPGPEARGRISGKVEFTAAAERVLELAVREAGGPAATEHLLLALVCEPGTPAARILASAGVRPWKVRAKLPVSEDEARAPRASDERERKAAALLATNRVRRERALLKPEMRSDPARLVRDPPRALLTFPVAQLLTVKLGRVGAARALTACGISPRTTVGSLSPRQRHDLEGWLRTPPGGRATRFAG